MTSGPPTAAPYWWRSSGSFGSTTSSPFVTVFRTKKFLASNASLRMYSNAVPWNAFVPDLVDTDTTPAPRPNSAEKTPESTLNSRTCSTDGVMMTVLNEVLVVVDAVNQPAVGVRLVPQGVEIRGAAGVERARAREVLARLPRRDAWREIHERGEVSAIQRQLTDGALLNHGANLGRVGPDEGRREQTRRSSFPPAVRLRASRRRGPAYLFWRMMPSRIDFLKPCTLTSTA